MRGERGGRGVGGVMGERGTKRAADDNTTTSSAV